MSDLFTVDDAIKLIKAMDDDEWFFSFDSLGMFNYLDTLSNIRHGIDQPDWKVFTLLDYMQRAVAERD